MPQWVVRVALWCGAGLLLAISVWLLVQALARVGVVSFSVAAALLLTALLQWVTDMLAGRVHLPRWAAALLSLVLLVAFVAAAFVLVVQRALAQVADLRKAVSGATQRLRDLLVGPLGLSAQRIDDLRDRISEGVAAAAPSATTGVTWALEVLSGAVLIVFLTFFFLKDGRGMARWGMERVPSRHRHRVEEAASGAWTTLTWYVRGTVLVALIDAIGIGVGMVALGVPLAASLTLIVFIGAFVPIVGAFVSGALAVGVAFVTNGPVSAIILLGVVLLVQQLEGNVLQPFIMGRALHLHPVVIVLSVSAGSLLAGVVGAIVAVPTVAVCYRVLQTLQPQRPASRE